MLGLNYFYYLSSSALIIALRLCGNFTIIKNAGYIYYCRGVAIFQAAKQWKRFNFEISHLGSSLIAFQILRSTEAQFK